MTPSTRTFQTSLCPELCHNLAASVVGRFSMYLPRRRKQEKRWIWLEVDVHWHTFWILSRKSCNVWASWFPLNMLLYEAATHPCLFHFFPLFSCKSKYTACWISFSFLDRPCSCLQIFVFFFFLEMANFV